jgi:hypothetical protein
MAALVFCTCQLNARIDKKDSFKLREKDSYAPALHSFGRAGRKPQMQTQEIVDAPTAGELFSDGHALELIRSGTDVALLDWNGESASVGNEFTRASNQYRPMQVSKCMLDAMPLPSRLEPHNSTGRLFTEIQDMLQLYGGQSDRSASWSSFFAMATWLAGIPSVALRLEILGSRSAALRLLQILRCLCRHAVLLSITRKADFWKTPFELQPTVLVYGAGANRATRCFLQGPAAHGLLLPNAQGELVNLHVPMAFYLGERPEGNYSASYRIVAPATPLPPGTPPWDQRTAHAIAEKFQPMLLDYRLRNFAKVSDSGFDAADLSSPLREQVNALAACIVGDDELRKHLLNLAADQDEDGRAERANDVSALVVEAALACCHEDSTGKVYIGNLTEKVNVLLKGRGVNMQLEPESVGFHLRRHEIYTKRLGSKGRGFLLLEEQKRLIHEVARRYDVPSVRNGAKRCEFCG